MVTGNQTEPDTFRYDNMESNNGGNMAGLAIGAVVLSAFALALLLWFASGNNRTRSASEIMPAEIRTEHPNVDQNWRPTKESAQDRISR